MAVFTSVSLEELNNWLTQFSLGQASRIVGIDSGIENSNFFITTEKGEYVLTLFEVLHFDQLPFYLELMRHLAQGGIWVPEPVPNHDGALHAWLNHKPAAIVGKLSGKSIVQPTTKHCQQVGDMLARMHLVGQDFSLKQNHLRGLNWWKKTAPQVIPYLDLSQQQLLTTELAYQDHFAQSSLYQNLPTGPIHADLFRNNVMFKAEQLTGFFDFYFAGVDTWLFDIAVTINDWCVHYDTGELDTTRAEAFLEAYQTIRPFTPAEKTAWPTLLRAAALRFWISRLFDFFQPRKAHTLTPHDPGYFEHILQKRRIHL